MLRNRSRAVTSKQASMADHHHTSFSSANQNHIASISSHLGSPRFFNDFLARNIFDPQNGIIANSINLENKNFSNFCNPFGYDRNLPKTTSHVSSENNKHIYDHKVDSQGIGLAILDSIKDEKSSDGDFSKQNSKMVLFGAKLKVQIPPLPFSADTLGTELPKSPADFGIKTRNSHIPSPLSAFRSDSPRNHVNGKISLSEMEMSEDYTCVVTHGPNPKTIHIFDNCVVDSCCGVVGLCELKKEHGLSTAHTSSTCQQSLNFLRFCHTCKDKLQDGKDIFMYRGEKAFCSHECRCQEMLSEGEKNSKLDY